MLWKRRCYSLIGLAGTPTTVPLGPVLAITHAPAPMIVFSPITVCSLTLAPIPIVACTHVNMSCNTRTRIDIREICTLVSWPIATFELMIQIRQPDARHYGCIGIYDCPLSDVIRVHYNRVMHNAWKTKIQRLQFNPDTLSCGGSPIASTTSEN